MRSGIQKQESDQRIQKSFRMNLRVLAAAAVVLFTWSLLSAAPVAAGRSKPSVAGQTTFLGAGRSALVDFPDGLSLEEPKERGEVPELEIRGNGRLIALVGSRIDDPSGQLAFVMARVRHCGNSACSRGRDIEIANVVGEEPGSSGIAAGLYRMYLVADDPEARVTLTLGRSGGRQDIRLRDRMDGETSTPTERIRESVTDSIYSNGDAYRFSGRSGLVFSAIELRGGPWVAGELGTCMYEGAPPDPIAFAPGCPLGASISIVDAVVRTNTDRVAYSMALLNGSERWGFGQYYEAAAKIDEVSATALHVSLDP